MTIAEDFVRRAAIHREHQRLSQAELARRMKAQGFPWHPMTVQRTESGERPLRLDEASALAAILGMPLFSDRALAVDLAAAHERANRLAGELAETRAALADLRQGRTRDRRALSSIRTALRRALAHVDEVAP